MTSLLIGRSRELAALALVLERASPVTIRGPGGVGKTALARAHARGRSALWVEMTGVHSAADAAGVLATTLGVAQGDEVGAAALSLAASSQSLVVVDNVEQLEPAATALLLEFARTTSARIVFTSRDALGDEATFDLGVLGDDDAMSLLASLAGGSDECGDAQREIVRRLDGLPLAIELAARRVAILGYAGLRERLDRKLDVLGVALRETIRWSWDHLSPDDRDALLACATFEGAFDAALAEAVIGAASEADALDRLERLRHFSLLHLDEEWERPRLRLREAVRDFARERLAELDASATTALWERHAEAITRRCAPLAEAIIVGRPLMDDLARLRADIHAIWRRDPPEHALRAALALAALAIHAGQLERVTELDVRAHEAGARTVSARIAVLKASALRGASRHRDAQRFADEAMKVAETLPETCDAEGRWLRIDAHRVAGAVARSRGITDRAIDLVERSLSLARESGERAREALALGELGAIHQSRGRLGLALAIHAEAIALHVTERSRRDEGVQRSFLAVAMHRSGRPVDAIALHESALAIHRETGHIRFEGAELLHLAFVHHEIDDLARSAQVFEEARRVLGLGRARGLEAYACVLQARLHVDAGELIEARLCLGEAKRMAEAGFPRLEAARMLVEGHLAMRAGEVVAASTAYAASLGACADVEVGFEALTPCYLALALTRADGTVSHDLIERSRSLAAAFENPHILVAVDILSAAITGGAPVAPSDAAVRSSSEVRRALALAGPPRGLIINDDGASVTLPDGRQVDLSRRKNLRPIVLLLARARRERPGIPVPAADLVSAGWPGERMRADAAAKRLHTAIWTLRSLGFDTVLRTDDGGYQFDHAVSLRADI